MATIQQNQLGIVERLYRSEYSAREIAEQLGVSIDAVYYSLRRIEVPRRTPVEQSRVLLKRKAHSYSIKKKLTAVERELFIAGIMLYWGEGSQWDGEASVDFANSKPEMIKVFLKFLRVVCGVDEQRLRCYLYCYCNQDVNALIRYWSKITKIPKKQFTKPYIRADYDERKKSKMPYGLIHIRYSDKRLLFQLKQWIHDAPERLTGLHISMI